MLSGRLAFAFPFFFLVVSLCMGWDRISLDVFFFYPLGLVGFAWEPRQAVTTQPTTACFQKEKKKRGSLGRREHARLGDPAALLLFWPVKGV